jgi:phenylalanyl-tRNA synthetase beta chain
LAAGLHLDFGIQKSQFRDMHPGRAAKVILDGKVIGRIGEIHPEIIAVNKLTGSVGGLELDLGAVLAQLKPVKVAAISRFPGTYRDVALVVRQTVTWSQIKRAINDTKLASPEFLSDYAGADLPPGHRSLAVRLIMVEPDRTLTDQAADERQAKVVVRLNRQFGAKLRS